MGGHGGILSTVANVLAPGAASLAPVLSGGKPDFSSATLDKTFNPLRAVLPGLSRSLSLGNFTGANAAKQSSKALSDSLAQQSAQTAETQRQLLLQPKTVTPDNFLSMKNNQLANLKLGFASTMSGGGGVPSAVISRPSLQAGGTGKSKFGQ